MGLLRFIVAIAFVGILAVPFFMRREGDAALAKAAGEKDAARLIVVTPHIEQIRMEFARGFDRWHLRKYGQHAALDFRSPGGTTEILKLLEAQYTDRLRSGLIKPDGSCPPGVVDFDMMLGGGSFDHTRLRRGVSVTLSGDQKVTLAMSTPPDPVFTEDELKAVFGENRIGAGKLYQDDRKDKDGKVANPNDWQYWIGTALSGFGIIYNRDVLTDLGLPEPKAFEDLGAYGYRNQLALADPRQSGSVATLYDSVLNESARRGLEDAKKAGKPKEEGLAAGWDHGWRVLRDMAANARYFSSASTQPPMDVSQGEAAAGVAIDFYGRGQAQSILKPGQSPSEGRMGYVDPAGAVYIDADPVSILRGGPNPVTARRFVEFCLTAEGQALWQLPPVGRDGLGASGERNPVIADDPGRRRMGPDDYRLRRMPVRRDFYDTAGPYWPLLSDPVNAFEIASSATTQGWRDAMIVMFGCWVDTGADLTNAWSALNAARADKALPPSTLAEMERLFYAFPDHTLSDGKTLSLGVTTLKAISDDTKRWRDPIRGPLARIAYTEFFKANFRKVVALRRSGT